MQSCKAPDRSGLTRLRARYKSRIQHQCRNLQQVPHSCSCWKSYENLSSLVTSPVAKMSDVGGCFVGIAVPGDTRLNYLSQLPCAVQDLFCNCRSDHCYDCVDKVISYKCSARSGPGVSEIFADYGRHTGCFFDP